MKTPLLALACMAAFSGAAHAQSAVTVDGALDAGLLKRSGAKMSIGKRDANTRGFKGVEELGSGLKAPFQLEIRYQPDTVTVENGVRPLFQGQSRVGLQGGFGMLRIGRGTAALPQCRANAEASANPFSISGTCKGGAMAAMLGFERNGIESTLWSVAASVKPVKALKLMASYADQDRGHTMAANENTSAWVVGANYTLAAGTVRHFDIGIRASF